MIKISWLWINFNPRINKGIIIIIIIIIYFYFDDWLVFIQNHCTDFAPLIYPLILCCVLHRKEPRALSFESCVLDPYLKVQGLNLDSCAVPKGRVLSSDPDSWILQQILEQGSKVWIWALGSSHRVLSPIFLVCHENIEHFQYIFIRLRCPVSIED